jgi:hypothetical protein
MTACNQLPEQSASTPVTQQLEVSAPDTTGLAQFEAWKAQNELGIQAPVAQVQQSVAAVRTPAPKAKAPVAKAPVATQPQAPTPSSGEVASNNGTGTSESAGEAKAAQKKKISKAAKGAVIGGVVGAAGGAVINKQNRVLGAVIGGVVGAAGGYGVGRGMDKKDGRIEYTPGFVN